MISDSVSKPPSRPLASTSMVGGARPAGSGKAPPPTEEISPSPVLAARKIATSHSEAHLRTNSPVVTSKKHVTGAHKPTGTSRARGGTKPAEEEDDLAAFFKRKKEGADAKGSGARPGMHGKSVKF